MADSKVNKNNSNKRRLSINLSPFANNNSDHRSNKSKSPKKFEEPNGVVGLGIVAAMHEAPQDPTILSKSNTARLAVLPKSSSPIRILSQRNLFKNNVKKKPSFAEMEMCEEYTCVMSHVGTNSVKKREYFDGDLLGVAEGSDKKFVALTSVGAAKFDRMSSEVARGSLFAVGRAGDAFELWMDDFLSSCFLCKKKLQGLDIYMYRGEKAFCSAECRDKHITVDELAEKCGSGVIKPAEYTVSPCSAPLQCFTGVAAA